MRYKNLKIRSTTDKSGLKNTIIHGLHKLFEAHRFAPTNSK
jgi:hypothetical protein